MPAIHPISVRALAATIVLSLLVPAVASLPTPGANDAGSGGDAGDARALATPLGPGAHRGTLSPTIDPVDHYVLSPPEGSILRLEVDGDVELAVALEDPTGRIRLYGSTGFGPVRFVGVAKPDGEWHLRVETVTGPTLILDAAYEITLAYSTHDHVVPIVVEASDATTLRADFPGDRLAFLELRYEARDTVAPDDAFAVLFHAQFETADSMGFASMFSWGRDHSGSRVWARGTLPEEVRLEPPAVADFGDLGDISVGSDGTEPFTFHVGIATSMGVSTTGWAVWDGNEDEFPVGVVEGSRATFRRVSDMEGDGPGIQAGPYAHVEGVGAAFEAPHESNLVLVDAFTPDWAMAPTEMVLRHPDGSTTSARGRYAALFVDEAPAGVWRADVVHADGREGNAFRFAAASFPIPNLFN